MPTLVDSLVVSLKLDSKQFDQGRKQAVSNLGKTKDAAVKHGKAIEESNKRLAETFASVRDGAIALFATLLGARGVSEFVADITRANTALGVLSANLAQSPQEIGALGLAIERAGGSADEASAAFQNATRALFALHNLGQNLPTPLLQMFGQAGMTPDTEHGVPAFLQSVATALRKVEAATPGRGFQFGKESGLFSDTMLRIMIDQGPAFTKFIESLKELAPLKATTDAARDLTAGLASLRQQFVAIGNDALPALDRAFRPILDDMTQFLKDNREIAAGKVFGWAKEAVDDLKGLGEMLGQIRDGLNFILNAEQSLYKLDIFGSDKAGANGIKAPAGGASTAVQGREVSRGNPMPVEIVKTPDSGGSSLWNWLFGTSGAAAAESPGGAGAPGGGGSWWSRHMPSWLGGGSSVIAPPGAGGTYRPVYKLGDKDLSDAVVNTIAGEATNSGASTDAVINNMFNRLGTKAYGKSGNLEEVARAPGQYTGYSVADAARAKFIRDRIRAIASGGVPDSTNGSNEYRAAWYTGPWGWAHPESRVIGGNRFAFNPKGGVGPYGPYATPHFLQHPHSRGLMPQGAKLSSLAAHKPVTTSQTSNALHVGRIDVHAPNATNSDEIAGGITEALRRSAFAMMAQSGQA